MDKITSYTDNIKKYVAGKEYSGKNIQTTDGKFAYVTNTGIAKLYNSDKSLNNENGCTNELQQIGSAWGDLGYPVGSLMVDGQSCGNETKYVQSPPPDANFDWQYFKQAYPELNIQTEQQAYGVWEILAAQQNLLPNQHFLTDMANVGKIGYVDINTTLHPVDPSSYKHSGEYKIFNTTPATGANMKDCVVPPPSVKYGDQLFIKNNNKFGSINEQSVLEFNKDKTILFLRPPPAFSAELDGHPISYGAAVCISATSSNVNVPDCGWWGCKVGYVNPDTSLLSFGPSGEEPKTFIINVASGTNFQNGTEIKYGNPFSLAALIDIDWSEQGGIDYGGNDINQSVPQPPRWSWWKPGWVGQPNQDRPSSIKPLAECQNLCASTTGCVGIVTDNSGQNQCWLKNKFAVANVNSDRNSYMLTPAVNSVAEIPSMSWSSEQTFTDYGGNDISHTYKSLEDCKTSCSATVDCKGIVTDNSGQNHCWLKNKFGNGTGNNDRNTYMLTVPVKLPPFQKTTTQEVILGFMYDVNVSFKTNGSSGQNIFSFESVTNPEHIPECSVPALQQDCTMDANCSGFIHSKVYNTWQKIPNNSTPDMFKVSNPMLPPNIYVKDNTVDNSKPKFIDSAMYTNYPTDNYFVKDGNECDIADYSEIESKEQEYNQINQLAAQQGEAMVRANPNIKPYIQKTKNIYTQMNTKTKEYKKLLKDINREKNNYNNTNEQQKTDLEIMQNSNKIHVFLWGLSSIIVISMVVMIKNKQ